MVQISVSTDDARRAMGLKNKTGTVSGYNGFRCYGKEIHTAIFERYNKVTFLGADGNKIGVFQDTVALDD